MLLVTLLTAFSVPGTRQSHAPLEASVYFSNGKYFKRRPLAYSPCHPSKSVVHYPMLENRWTKAKHAHRHRHCHPSTPSYPSVFAGEYTLSVGKLDTSAAAWGSFADTLNVTGWGVLDIRTGAEYTDVVQHHAAGVLEGALTA